MSEILNESLVLLKSGDISSETESLQDLERPLNTKIATQLLPENVNFLSHKERTELFSQILNKMNNETYLKNNQNAIQFMVSYCLNQIEFFKILARNFGSEIIFELMKLLKREDFARDEIIFEKGERNNKLFVIIQGSVMLYDNSNANESQGGTNSAEKANKKNEQVQNKQKESKKRVVQQFQQNGSNKSNNDQKSLISERLQTQTQTTTLIKDNNKNEDNKQLFAGQALSEQIVLSDEDYFNPRNAKAVAVHNNNNSYHNSHFQYQQRSLLQSQSSICKLLVITRADFKRILNKHCKQELLNRTLYMSNFTFLDSLSPRELLTLAINFDQMIFNRGDIVFEQNSQDISEIFFVKEGSFMLQIAVNEEQDDAQHVLRAKRTQKYYNIHPLGENTLFGVEGLNLEKIERFLEDLRKILQTEKDDQDMLFSDNKSGRQDNERIKELESEVPRRIGRVVCESTRGCVFRVKISSILSYLSIEEERQKLSVLCDSLLETQTTKILDLVDVQVSNRRETEEIKKQSKYLQPAVEFLGMRANLGKNEGEEGKNQDQRGILQRISFSAQQRGFKSEDHVQQMRKKSILRNRKNKTSNVKNSNDEISIQEHLEKENKKRQMRQCSPLKKTDQKLVQSQTIKENQDQFQKDWNEHFSTSNVKNRSRCDSQGCLTKHSDIAYITENQNQQSWFNKINTGNQVQEGGVEQNHKMIAIHESIEKHEQEDYDESRDSNKINSTNQGILRELSDLQEGSSLDDQEQKKQQTQGEEFLKQLFYFCGERNERIAKENSLNQLKMSFLSGDVEQSKLSVVVRNTNQNKKKKQDGNNQNLSENCVNSDDEIDDDTEQAKNLEEYLRRKLIHKLKDSQIYEFNKVFGYDIIEMSKANDGSSEYEQRVVHRYNSLRAKHAANFKNIAEIVRNLNYSYSQVREFFNKLNHKDRFFQDIFLKSSDFPDVANAVQRNKWGNVINGDVDKNNNDKKKNGQDKQVGQVKIQDRKNDEVQLGKSRVMLRKNLINKLNGQEEENHKKSQMEQQTINDQLIDNQIQEKIEITQNQQIQAAKDTMSLLQGQAEKQAGLINKQSPRKVVVVVREQQRNSKISNNNNKRNNNYLLDNQKGQQSHGSKSTNSPNLLQSFSCSTRMNSSSSSSSSHGLFNLSSSAFHQQALRKSSHSNRSTKNATLLQGLSCSSVSRPNTSPGNQNFSLEMQNNSEEMNLTLPDSHINRNKYTKIPKQFRKQQKLQQQQQSISSLASVSQKQSITGGQETFSQSQGLFPLKEGSYNSSTHSLMGQINRNINSYVAHKSDGFQVVDNNKNPAVTNITDDSNSISSSIKLHQQTLTIQGSSKIDGLNSVTKIQRSPPAILKMNKTFQVSKSKKDESMNIFPIQENYFKKTNTTTKHIQRAASASSNNDGITTDELKQSQNELIQQQSNSTKKQINPTKIFLSLSPSSPKGEYKNWEDENEGEQEHEIESDYHQKGFRRNRSALSSTKATKKGNTKNFLISNQSTGDKNNIIKRASSVQHQRERSSILKNNYNINNDSTKEIPQQVIQRQITLQPQEYNENQQIYTQNRSRRELNSIILTMQRDLLQELKKTTKGIDRTSPHVQRQKSKQTANSFLQIQPLTQNLAQDVNVQYQQQTPSPPPPLPAVFLRKTTIQIGNQRNSPQV